jgi:hypothetical protein
MSDVIALPNPAPDGAAAAICAGCGAPLAPDQRYCLSCGRPSSPVRLAFLDVLQGEYQTNGVGGSNAFPTGVGGASLYASPPEPEGTLGSLRRYSGLFGLLGVLLAALLIGLLVGHWLTGGSSSGPQVLKVDLNAPLAAATPAATSTTGSAGTSSGSGSGSNSTSSTKGASNSHTSSKSEEKAEEVKDAKEVAKPKPLPAAHKASSTLEKLAHSTGKKHAEEVSKLGNAPIETGH